jgi:hypothetical protein
MNTDDFEKKLQQPRIRQSPGDWREPILRTALARTPIVARRFEIAPLRGLLILWRELIKPSRYAWSGLAVVWLILGIVNARTQLPATHGTIAASPLGGGERLQILVEQRLVLVELTGPIDLSRSERARRPDSKPRSERMSNTRGC